MGLREGVKRKGERKVDDELSRVGWYCTVLNLIKVMRKTFNVLTDLFLVTHPHCLQ